MGKKQVQKRTIYNWEALKREYIEQHNIIDATAWIRHKMGVKTKTLNSSMSRGIRGWTKLWKENQKAITIKMLEMQNTDKAEKMAKALENIVGYFAEKTIEPHLRVDDAEKVWKIIRVENGLPSTISKNIVTVPKDPEDSLDALQEGK